MEFKYLQRIHELMDIIEKEESAAMEACVDLLAEAVLKIDLYFWSQPCRYLKRRVILSRWRINVVQSHLWKRNHGGHETNYYDKQNGTMCWLWNDLSEQ